MPHRWLSHIDNIASFRDGTLLFDIERHTARRISSSGKIAHAAPRYSFMIDHCNAVEGRLFKRPLTSRTFTLALTALPGYSLERQSAVSIKYANPNKGLFCTWEDCVSFSQARAGTMVGLIQTEPVESIEQVLEKTLPTALEDWNRLARVLDLRRIDRSLYHKLARQAKAADARFPKQKSFVKWPKNPIRFLFEQE